MKWIKSASTTRKKFNMNFRGHWQKKKKANMLVRNQSGLVYTIFPAFSMAIPNIQSVLKWKPDIIWYFLLAEKWERSWELESKGKNCNLKERIRRILIAICKYTQCSRLYQNIIFVSTKNQVVISPFLK